MKDFNINEIVNSVSYRTENGMVDWKNSKHVAVLEDILIEQNFPAKFVAELIASIKENGVL